MKTFVRGETVAVKYGVSRPLLCRYDKPFVAADGEALHRVDALNAGGGVGRNMIVDDGHIQPIGARRFWAEERVIYELRDGAITQIGHYETEEVAIEAADRMQAGVDAGERARRPTAEELFRRLEHGNAEHRTWLRETIAEAFAHGVTADG